MKKFLTLVALSLLPLTGCVGVKSPEPVVAPVAPPPPDISQINKFDFMSRQFTLNEADLVPVPNSTRPSAVIFFKDGVNVRKMNKALCEGFVQLPTPGEIEQTKDVPIENQVATKVPVRSELPQNLTDCDEILKVYDYILAEKELGKLNPSLKYSNGPFVAIYNPNSTEINQIIDLRGTSVKNIKKFGENWSLIFTEAAEKHEKSSQADQKFNILGFVRDMLQVTVCATDPNLIYIFNEPAGKIADIVCKGTAETTWS